MSTRSFSDDDLTAPMASGSNALDAFVIIPASTSTIGKIASGIGDTLITRTAQVCLKERFTLIICVRETPLSTLTLEQCARLSAYGAIIMPISPPMYFVPEPSTTTSARSRTRCLLSSECGRGKDGGAKTWIELWQYPNPESGFVRDRSLCSIRAHRWR